MRAKLTILSLLLAVIGSVSAARQGPPESGLVPFPKTCEPADGRLVLNPECRIAAADRSLMPLADVASGNMDSLFGVKARVKRGHAGSGGIELRIDKRLKGEAYAVEVGDRALISGGSFKAVAWGLVTLLQLAEAEDGRVSIPCLKLGDQPDVPYRGLVIDLAREWHPIEVVKQAVVLCHWYKIGYLQLHLSDDQSWTFPSTAYPNLATPGRHYTLQELRDLEAFARRHGVTIVPELDVPGHSAALVKALPNVVGSNPLSPGTLCAGRESTYKVLDVLIGEVSRVFTSSPYFHVGADEVNKSAWSQCQYCGAYRRRHGIDDDEELYRHFIVRMNEIVKKHGKRTIVWEGFKVTGKIRIPRDITVMEFESLYELPQNLLAAGYTVINTAWQPLYVVNQKSWPPEKIYEWNMYRWENWWEKSIAYPNGIDVTPTPLVIGAQMCAWEQTADIEIPSLRRRLAALSERLWNHGTRRPFEDFAARLEATDAKLTKLLEPRSEIR